MKIAVVKLGARVSYNANDTSGGNGEARSIINMLAKGGAEVHVYTKILKKDNLVDYLVWHNIEDDYTDVNTLGFDALVVINGNVNFFGGAEDRPQILNYDIVNNIKCPVFYAHCDPALVFRQLWPSIEKKPWAENYQQKDIDVQRSDVHVICQQYNLQYMEKEYEKKNAVLPKSITQFPFEKFPLLNERMPFNENPEWDLSYGGTMRGGKREDKIIEYYFGLPEEITVELFGKIEEKHFDPKKIVGKRFPEFGKAVKYNEMIQKMNQSAAHIVIGDKQYGQCEMLNQRIYESILAGCVTFIDRDLDMDGRVYAEDSLIAGFLYVDGHDDAAKKLIEIKHYPIEFREELVKAQYDACKFNADEYCKSLIQLIKNRLENPL